MSDYSVHIVIDNGSWTTKAGFNGENAPRVVVPTLLGQSKKGLFNLVEESSKFYIGRDVLNNSSYLDIHRPIKNGIIDAEKMEKIWSHIFTNELKVKPEAHNVFLTESIHSSNKEREKIAEIMFEKFSIFNIHIEPQQVMSLYSTTKTSGLIIESGEGSTEIVPIYEGYIIPQGIRSSPIAGEFITRNMFESIRDKLKKQNVGNPIEQSRRIKEKFSEVCMDDELIRNFENLKLTVRSQSETFTLPDGNVINISNEKFLAPEVIFNPEINSLDCSSLQQLVCDSINNVDVHLRKDFLSNIVLGGGNTMIKNFPERLKMELQGMLPNNKDHVKINAQKERLYSSWIGASVVCSISNFQQMWVSKNDWEEIGPSIIHKKYIY
jgi:actin, other eukaryote